MRFERGPGMDDLSQLITATAALITAIGGAIGVVVTAVKASNRQSKDAAEKAASFLDGEQNKRIEELEDLLEKIRGKDDE